MREEPQVSSLERIIEGIAIGIASNAYQEVARETGKPVDEIYRSNVCEQISDALYRGLRSVYGESVQKMSYRAPGFLDHTFVRVHIGNESEPVIIDPTWQQFLSKPDPSLPRVLCGRVNKLQNTLSAAGIPTILQEIWTRAVEVESTDT